MYLNFSPHYVQYRLSGYGLVVEHVLAKDEIRVRFPVAAHRKRSFIFRESKAGARAPVSRRDREAGSRKFQFDGIEIIRDRFPPKTNL